MTDTIDYRQASGTTRDCQRRRFSDSNYVDCTESIRRCFNIIRGGADFDAAVTKEGIALIKMTFFAVFDQGRCYVPLTIWKEIGRSVISLRGGKRRLREENPSFLHQLERTDRPTLRGAALRNVVLAHFEDGLAGIGGLADA